MRSSFGSFPASHPSSTRKKSKNQKNSLSGDQPALSPRRLSLFNTSTRSVIQELPFTEAVLAVRMNRRALVAVSGSGGGGGGGRQAASSSSSAAAASSSRPAGTPRHVSVFALDTLELVASSEHGAGASSPSSSSAPRSSSSAPASSPAPLPAGSAPSAVALSPCADPCLLALPSGSGGGSVRVYDLGPTVDAATSGGSGSGGGGGGGGGCGGGGGRPVLPAPLFEIPRAHSAPLAAAAWSADASLLATASTKGTLVRVWEVERRAKRGGGAAVVGRKLCAFRRGSTPAGATALAFGPPREAGGGSIRGEQQQQQQQQRQQQQQPRRPRRPRRPELLAAASERGTVHLFRLPREGEDEEEGGDDGGAGERGAVGAGKEGQGAGRAVAALLSSSSRALLSGRPRAPPSAAAAARLPDALAARAVATVRLPAPTAGVSLALYAKGGGGASGGKQEERKQTGAGGGGGGGGSESDGERDGASSLDGAPRAEPSSEPPAKAATTVTVLGLAVATVEGALYEYSVEIDRAKFRGRRGSGGRSNSGGGGTGGGGENDSGVSVSLERELFVGRGAD